MPMTSSPIPPRHDVDATRADNAGFRFTVPHAWPDRDITSAASEQSAWRGITARWLAAAESAV